MKILYIVQGAAPYGANKSLIDLIDYVRQRGIDPYVIGTNYGVFSNWISERGIRYERIHHRFSTYPPKNTILRKLFYFPNIILIRIINLYSLIRLIFICMRVKPDVIHTNIGPVSIGYLVSKVLNIKHIWHLREYQDLDFNLHYFPSKNFFVNQLRNSERVICVSNGVKNHFEVIGNSIVIPNGVCFEKDKFIDLDKGDFFLFAGRLESAKGIEVVLEAFNDYQKLSNSTAKLLIAGDGAVDYVERIKKKYNKLIIEDRVVFLGFRTDTLQLMRKAKALIVASEYEGFGRITAEAMFNGCLVIGRNSGGTAEILDYDKKNKLGFFFDDKKSLIDCLIRASNLDVDIVNMITLAQQKAVNVYTIDRYAKAILDVYRSIDFK